MPVTSLRSVLEHLLSAERIQEEWFALSFLARVPISQIEQVLTNLKSQLGAYQAVLEAEGEYLAVFERGVTPIKISLDERSQISMLSLQTPRRKDISLEGVLEDFNALPGRSSLLVLENGSERVSINPDVPLAVGSAFKLAVLAALKELIASGEHSWHDVVELQPFWKSLPSGLLQDWPEGAPLTLHTMAALMITQSDNTAADGLIFLVGREAIEHLAPHTRPFPTTREAFILKDPKNGDLLERYRHSNVCERQAALKEARTRCLPALETFSTGLLTLEVEWFFTARELCELIQQVADLPLMGINPGIAKRNDWARVAFKGGSEPGVLNLTTQLLSTNEKTYCIVATWNDDMPVDEMRFFRLYSELLQALMQCVP
jgi:beta-lactamase class A